MAVVEQWMIDMFISPEYNLDTLVLAYATEIIYS